LPSLRHGHCRRDEVLSVVCKEHCHR
jgi:hypothetical protein